MNAQDYGSGCRAYEAPARRGYLSLRVLPCLTGQPWDDLALALVDSLRPSYIRTTDGEVKTDARCWRVTVYLADGFIERIEQEVEVGLPDGVAHGHALRGILRERGIDL